MKTTSQISINELNYLLEIKHYRKEVYDQASKETKEIDLKNLFSQFERTRHNCQEGSIAEVKKLGGTSIEGTRTFDRFFRAWIDVKSTFIKKIIKQFSKPAN